jgi:hypothetical protein
MKGQDSIRIHLPAVINDEELATGQIEAHIIVREILSY